jgi:crotonobetainyl-CoA:carnitine CoA-transferase CaiB-like acyl-CoA transferase
MDISDCERVPHKIAPTLGQDTEEILLAFGCEPSLIEHLRDQGAVR